jgi:hypothetical protein
VPLVITPSTDRFFIERLSDLIFAGSVDGPDRVVEIEAPRVPRESAELNHLAAHFLLILDQVLVINLKHRHR